MRAHLQPLGSVDGPQRPEHSEDSQDFHHVDRTGPAAEAGSESSAVNQIESTSFQKWGWGEGSVVESGGKDTEEQHTRDTVIKASTLKILNVSL